MCVEYFLEDIVQLLNYKPNPDGRKRKYKDKDEESAIEGQDHEVNYNLHVSDEYPPDVRARVGMMSEKDVDFDIIEASFSLILTNSVFVNLFVIYISGVIIVH